MGRRIKPRRRKPHRSPALKECKSGKFCYQSKAHALSATLNRAIKGGQRLRAYKCRDCPYWHMTSRTEQKERR